MALIKAINRRKVRAPSPAATKLLTQVRTAWKDALAKRDPDHDPDQWAALARRVDELLYALALSQPSGRRPMRPDLLHRAERSIPMVLEDLARAVDGDRPTPPIPVDDHAIIHYPRYDPNPH